MSLKLNITISLDGFVAATDQSVVHPLGEGGEELHEWAFAVRTFRAMHGKEGGTTGPRRLCRVRTPSWAAARDEASLSPYPVPSGSRPIMASAAQTLLHAYACGKGVPY